MADPLAGKMHGERSTADGVQSQELKAVKRPPSEVPESDDPAQSASEDGSTDLEAMLELAKEVEEKAINAEARAVEAEKARDEVEALLAKAEAGRQIAEEALLEAEKACKEAEEQAAKAEADRDEAEQLRHEAENALLEAEKACKVAEERAAKAEADRDEAEQLRHEAESDLAIAEEARQEAENALLAAEKACEEAEQRAAKAEAARDEARAALNAANQAFFTTLGERLDEAGRASAPVPEPNDDLKRESHRISVKMYVLSLVGTAAAVATVLVAVLAVLWQDDASDEQVAEMRTQNDLQARQLEQNALELAPRFEFDYLVLRDAHSLAHQATYDGDRTQDVLLDVYGQYILHGDRSLIKDVSASELRSTSDVECYSRICNETLSGSLDVQTRYVYLMIRNAGVHSATNLQLELALKRPRPKEHYNFDKIFEVDTGQTATLDIDDLPGGRAILVPLARVVVFDGGVDTYRFMGLGESRLPQHLNWRVGDSEDAMTTDVRPISDVVRWIDIIPAGGG